MNSMVDDILPDGWENTTIEATCEVLDRLRKPISQKDRKSGKYPYYGATKIVDYINDFIFDERLVLVGEDGAKWESGDKTGFIAEGKYWVNNHAHVLRVDKDILIDKWLVNFLYVSDLSDYITGTTVPKLNQAKLKSINFPLPPISEQKRIVAKIDTLFGKIDKAINLTEESLKQAKNLLPSVLKEVFENGKTDGWEEKKWDEVLEIKNGKSQKEYLVSEGGYPIYGSGGVMNGRVSKFLCPNNTTIIGRKGTIDKPKYVEEEFWNVDTAFGLCAKTGLNPRFLYYFCLTFNFRSLNKSTTLPSLTKRDLLQISMPYTNSKNQNKVVKIANDILLKSKQTQSKFEEQLTHLKNLKSSILSKAFAGEL